MKALINMMIYDFHSFINNGFVKFDSEIEEVGDMDSFTGAEEVIDCRGCIVMPGLTNCHTHIYSTFARGMNIYFNPKSFKEILEQLWWKLDGQLDKSAVYRSAAAYGIDCLSNGVTSIIDHHASGLCIEGSLETINTVLSKGLGMRGVYCFETSDRFPLNKCLQENISFAANSSEFTGSMFGLHASMSLSGDSLNQVSKAVGDTPIHIHIAESMDDVEDCYEKYNKSIIERLESHGILNRNSVLAHCVHINEQEAEIIGSHGCYVALNPTSNMNNAVGLPDYELFRRKNIKCIVGNDGLGANITRDYLNLMFSMKNRLCDPTKFTLADMLHVVRNGYELMESCLSIKLGRIQKSYKADMLAVPYNPPTPVNEGNILGHILFGVFDGFKPKHVWVSGKQLIKDYAPTFDIEPDLEKARLEAHKVWKRLGAS